jgi:hypothetical protein
MRLIRLSAGAVATAIIGFLAFMVWQFPLEIAKEIIIQPIAEEISRRTGFKMPTIENIISSASIVVPILAAICTLYLYHAVYEATDRRNILIREHVQDAGFRTILSRIKTAVATLFLVAFIGAVLVAGYKENFGPPIPGPALYTDLHRLPALELRSRALAVGDRLYKLNQQYNDARAILAKQYATAVDKYNQEMTDFHQKQAAYEQAVRSCAIPSLSLTGPPLFGQQQTCNTPPIPDKPQEPQFPQVIVDSQWTIRALAAEVEAAAIWEELMHRQGGYTQFFSVPDNYNDENSHIRDYAKELESEANKLR